MSLAADVTLGLFKPLQALVVLDYRLIIVKRTAAVVQLGRRGGGLV